MTQPVATLKFRFNYLAHYDLPSWTDDEGHEVFLVTTKTEVFITQVDKGYLFEPKVPTKDIGDFVI